MCLVSDMKSPIDSLEDIVVYKLLLRRGFLRKNYTSLYHHFSYKKGCSYSGKLTTSTYFANQTIVESGFHSYAHLDDAIHDKFLEEGRKGRVVICEFVIPAGTRYYFGLYGSSPSYASDEITFIREIKV